jgi:hypothetical protein
MAVGRSRRRVVATAAAAALACGPGLVPLRAADAVTPCTMAVAVTLKNTLDFAGGSRLRRYVATVADPASGTVQRARVLLTRLPLGARPTVLATKIGTRQPTGQLAQSLEPQALAAVNGDFFSQLKIRGRTLVAPLGPIVRDGRVVRASRSPRRVVGLDTQTPTPQPFAGSLGVRGSIAVAGTSVAPLMGVNWETVAPGGATVYTPDWNPARWSPRPAGAVEWVLDGSGTVLSMRSDAVDPALLGAPVADGTRVVAFAADVALTLPSVSVGNRVTVRVRQHTSTGARLTTAVGRGLPLVQGGVAGPVGCSGYAHSTTPRPRTVVGWTATGRWGVVTVPGTSFTSTALRIGGLGVAQAANVAARMGLVEAYVLDGGGSTTLYTRDDIGTWRRRDLWRVSDGTYERSVPTGLAFVAGASTR